MNKHLNILLHGKVQGVGFRWATMKAAHKFGIAGFVRNEPDGSLYIEAEGEEENLQKFAAWSKKGPLWARVDGAEIREGALVNFKEFVCL
jgi:acylphosphatase